MWPLPPTASFSLFFYIFLLFLGLCSSSLFLSHMLGRSEVRALCPSISFLFACLWGSLGAFLYLENFALEGSGLCIALGDLLPLLCWSIDWFEGLIREQEVISEVRSSELETRSSSSDDLVKGDTTISSPREVRAFHTLEEACALDGDTLARF